MNIINRQQSMVNFRGFGNGMKLETINLSRRSRVKLAEFYPTIRDSKVVDLDRTFPHGNLSNYFYIRVKEAIPGIVDGIKELRSSSILKFIGTTRAERDGRKIICKDVLVEDETKNIVLDMGTEEAAELAMKDFNINGEYDDFVPQFAALIDTHTKIRPLIDEMKSISDKVLRD